MGRAKLRPLIRRSIEQLHTLNMQLYTCLHWWRVFLRSYFQRVLPLSIANLPVVVSYSDGEGGHAGVGVAVWSPERNRPVAAFAEVPAVIRKLWARQAGKEAPFNDIFLIEAVGPLIILKTFPNIVRQCLWIHFIDTAAAQYALVRGSSSIASGDQ